MTQAKKQSTVAVTGASGFIGTHLLVELKKRQINNVKLTRPEVDLVTGIGINESLQNVDTVINLVGTSPYPTFSDQLDINVLSLNNLCKTALENKVKKVIHISASAINTNTPYGLTKSLGEEVCNFYYNHFGLSFIILRPPSVYGPGSTKGVVNIFAEKIKQTGEITIFGDGSQTRDFMYIDDLVDVIIKSIHHPADYEHFSVGSGKTSSIIDLLAAFQKAFDKKIQVIYVKDNTPTPHKVTANIYKAKKILNWEPKVSLIEGLRRIL